MDKPVPPPKARNRGNERRLDDYRKKRHRDRTPEPIPPGRRRRPVGSATPSTAFVIQEHHASSLHWDFRLERDGVLVSWALPKGLPVTPEENHLAVHVENHPLEYGSFSGTIPAGEYGAGNVSIWDRGTYECEKWTDREIKVVLHGDQAIGRYVLFPTKGKNWMIHRMDAAPYGYQPLPGSLSPMLAEARALPEEEGRWAFEFKWDGIRALVWVAGGRARALSRNGNDITGSFPELLQLGEALGSTQAVLDGELVVLGTEGRPSFSGIQHRIHVSDAKQVARAFRENPASLILFDLLHLNGRSLLEATYDERRSALEGLGLGGPHWALTPSFTDEPGAVVMRAALEHGMEGVVAKRRSARYRPGARSRDWIKVKAQSAQEVVVGGWTPGQGSRRPMFGALLLGLPSPGARGKLAYVGKVGTGFSRQAMETLQADMAPLTRATSPFDAPLPAPIRKSGAVWVQPTLVGEVRFTEWTADGHFRHPVWRGLRADKRPQDVLRES